MRPHHRLAIAVPLAILLVSSGSTSAFAEDDTPQFPGIPLASYVIPAPENDDFWVLGKVVSIEPTGEEFNELDMRRPRSYDAGVRIEVERTFFSSAPFETQEIEIRSVSIPTQDSGNFDGLQGGLKIGDRIFTHVSPRDPEGFRCISVLFSPPFTYASQVEVDRLIQVEKILGYKDTQAVARAAMESCLSEDPYLALWCVDLLEPRQEFQSEQSRAMFRNIREQVTEREYLEILWRLLGDPSTHTMVYVRADEKLGTFMLSDNDQANRHAFHRSRIVRLIHEPPPEVSQFQQAEVQYVLRDAYPEMNVQFRLDIVDTLRGIAELRDARPSRYLVYSYAGELYDPREEGLCAKIFQLYRDHNILLERDALLLNGFRSGLGRLMDRQSDHLMRPSMEGAEILSELVNFGTEQVSSGAARTLTSHAEVCRRKKIDAGELHTRLRSVRDNAPHRRTREYVDKWFSIQPEQ